MKKQLTLLVTSIPFILGLNDVKTCTEFKLKKPKKHIIEIKQVPVKPVRTLDTKVLINALIEVESLGNDAAIGDLHLVGNEAVGALQIRPVMIREVNRILKIQKSKKRFKRSDRFSRERSIEMFMVWKNHHHPNASFEKISRNWNGGPRGYKKKGTRYYWEKVKTELNK